jgi:O-antigen ligase
VTRAKPSPVLDALFFATLFTVTFAKLQWEVAGTLSLSDVLTAVFLAVFAATRLGTGDRRLAWGAVAAALFFLAFLTVYLIGFFNLGTEEALAQWGKGMVKFLLHFLFLVAGIAYLVRRSERFYWTTFAVFMAGFVANAVYGIVQLGTAEVLGINLDQSLLQPITGGASQINIYGAIEGANVYRPNALTGDPNHLGIELVIPLLVLTPIYLRLERGHRLKVPLACILAFLLVVELATLSRSGLLGLAAGLLVLAVPYRRKLVSPALLVPLGAVAAAIGLVVAARWDFFEQVLRTRVDTSAEGTSTHFDVYGFIPDVLSSNPFFGLGLNNFSVYYEFVTGRTNFGPHSFYVATLVETGLVGTVLFAAFLVYLFRRLGRLRAIGRALQSRRIRPLAWGMTAALVGTIAANAFYLTMSFYYFFAFAMLALAAPIVFGVGLTEPSRAEAPALPVPERKSARRL